MDRKRGKAVTGDYFNITIYRPVLQRYSIMHKIRYKDIDDLVRRSLHLMGNFTLEAYYSSMEISVTRISNSTNMIECRFVRFELEKLDKYSIPCIDRRYMDKRYIKNIRRFDAVEPCMINNWHINYINQMGEVR